MRNLNELPRPRVLVEIGQEGLRESVIAALKGFAASVRLVESRADVNQGEWDAVVTTEALSTVRASTSGRKHSRAYASHLQAFVLHAPDKRFIDFASDSEDSILYAVENHEVVGTAAYLPPDVSEALASLARTQLLPLTKGRHRQSGIRPVNPVAAHWPVANNDTFEPIMSGPDGLSYAARYLRTRMTSAWVIPHDVADLRPWFESAFADWHALNPAVFPGSPDWIESPEWFSVEESALALRIQREAQSFEEARAQHEASLQRLEAEMSDLRAATAAGDRLLLSGQGDPLQDEVLAALRELGFDVEDMDEVWNERERREDYRVRDAADPEWMVIADATGTTKGVKGAKLMTVQRFVTKWVAENPGQPIPGYWVIANHFSETAPAQRRKDLIRGDELAAARLDGGLVVDTVALFHLLRAVRTDPSRRRAAREQLRQASGQYTASDALAWVESGKAPA